MSFVFNSTKANAPAIEAGPIEMTIKRAGYKTEATGTPFVNLLWEDVDGRSIWNKLYITENNTKRIVAFCDAIGRSVATELDGKTLDQAFLTQWAETLLGESATLDIELKWSEYYGRNEPNVRWYRPMNAANGANDLLDLDESLDDPTYGHPR